jgi:Skp family chaperone for outer membrane proteins
MSLNKLIKLTVFGTAILFSLNAIATDSKAGKSQIAVVDTQKILEGSSAIKKIRDAVDDQMKALQKEASKLEEGFKKKFEDLEAKRATASKEEFEKKSQEVSKDFNDAQQKLNDKKAKIDSTSGEAMQKVQEAFAEAVKEEANKTDAEFVMQRGQILYVKNDTSDLTAKVLTNLNKKLPSVDVKF